MIKTHHSVFIELFGKDILKLDYKYVATVLHHFEKFIYKPITDNHHRNYMLSEKKQHIEFMKKFKRYSFSFSFDDFHKKFTFNFTYTWYRGKKLLDMTVTQFDKYFIINIKAYISYFGNGYIAFPSYYPVLNSLHQYYPNKWETKKDYQFNIFYDFTDNDSYTNEYGCNIYIELGNKTIPLKEHICIDGMNFKLDYNYDDKTKKLLNIDYSAYIGHSLYLGVKYSFGIDVYTKSRYNSQYYKNISLQVINYLEENSLHIKDLTMLDIETIEMIDY